MREDPSAKDSLFTVAQLVQLELRTGMDSGCCNQVLRVPEAGKQNTKRLLPDFLIPYSPVRLDRVLEAELKRRKDGASLEDCSFIMGCLELRTVRKHLNRLHEAAAAVSLQLSEYLARTPQYGKLPESDPDQCAVMRLHTMRERILQAASASGQRVIPLRQNLQEHWWHLVGNPSTNCASRNLRPP